MYSTKAMSSFSFLNPELYTDTTEMMEIPKSTIPSSSSLHPYPDMNPSYNRESAKSSSTSSNLEDLIQTLFTKLSSVEKRMNTMEERVNAALEMINRKKTESLGCSWRFIALVATIIVFVFICCQRYSSYPKFPTASPPSQSVPVIFPAGGLPVTSSNVSGYPPNLIPSGMSTAFFPPKM